MMTKVQYLLTKLAEEANEIGVEALKCQQFGLSEIYEPIGITNEERLINELNDLQGVIAMLQDHMALSTDIIKQEKVLAKMAKVEKYMKYSQSLGLVEKDEV